MSVLTHRTARRRNEPVSAKTVIFDGHFDVLMTFHFRVTLLMTSTSRRIALQNDPFSSNRSCTAQIVKLNALTVAEKHARRSTRDRGRLSLREMRAPLPLTSSKRVLLFFPNYQIPVSYTCIHNVCVHVHTHVLLSLCTQFSFGVFFIYIHFS